jgi:hypothetical protein
MKGDHTFTSDLDSYPSGEKPRLRAIPEKPSRREENEGAIQAYLAARVSLDKAYSDVRRAEIDLKNATQKVGKMLLGSGGSAVGEVIIWIGNDLYKVTRMTTIEGCKVETVALGN